MVAHSLVDALIVAGQDDEVALQRQLVGYMLVEAFAVRRGEDHFVVVALGLQGTDAAVYRLALHHHSCRTAVGIVVHPPPFVQRVVSQVVKPYLGQSFLLCPGQYRFVHESLQHLGQYGNNVYSHS